MRAADTNVLVRLIVRDDAVQAEQAGQFVAHGVWASHVVLAETIWVMSERYKFDSDAIANAVEMLLNQGDVTLQDADVVAAALAAFRRQSGATFVDCLIVEIARKAGHLPLGTFDRGLAKLDGVERVDLMGRGVREKPARYRVRDYRQRPRGRGRTGVSVPAASEP